jgi:hypothetical protein
MRDKMDWNKQWIQHFEDLGLSKDEATEVVEIANRQNSRISNTDDILRAIYTIVAVFDPQEKVGDWLDIFR